ncbi:MAG: DUF6476 family protein [Alphaproteobacteria bacterium]
MQTTPVNLRALKMAVVIMAVLIVLVASAIVAVIAFRLSGGAESRHTPPPAWQVEIAAAATILSVVATDDGLAILVEARDGRRSVLLMDPDDGRILGRVEATEP